MDPKTHNSIKDISLSNPQDKNALENIDKLLLRSARQAESITSAIYIVSNILPEKEPLQAEIRSAGLQLIKETSDILGTEASGYVSKEVLIQRTIKRILSLLEVGAILALISEMNHRILKHELLALGGSYESRRSTVVDISGIFNPLPQLESSFGTEEEKLRLRHKGHVKDIEHKGQTHKFHKTDVKSLYKSLQDNFKRQSISTDGNERKDKIIKVIKDKEEVSIMDFKNHIKDVSFKTIQRDLQSLIDAGVIVREGERRWSVYRLNDK